MNLRDLPDMSEALRQVYEKKKLDPVGKEDGDIDNDGDRDSSDSYLLHRRKTVTKAMGKKTHICAKTVKKEGKEYQTIPEQHTMLEDGTVTHYDITDGEYIYENVPVEELEILVAEAHEHFDNYDKNAEVLDEGLKQARKNIGMDPNKPSCWKGYKAQGTKKKGGKEVPNCVKEAFAFSEEEFALLEQHGEEIDALTDEELVDFMEEMILDIAEDDADLLEMCDHLEEVSVLSEEKYKQLELKLKPSRMDRLKSAAKKAGSAIKAGAKKAGKKATQVAGKVAGEFSAAKAKQKAKAMSRPEKKKSSGDDDDGTGGKLDALLAKTRGTSSSSSSSSGGGGDRDAGSEARERLKSKKKKGPGLLKKIGSAVKKGLKKAVGKTARVVSKGSDKLAKRLGEDYDHIAHLYESGLFSMQEIENVIEEGYKEIDREKRVKMYRKAGNAARSGDAKTMNKMVSAINKHSDNRGIQYPTGKKQKTSVAKRKEQEGK